MKIQFFAILLFSTVIYAESYLSQASIDSTVQGAFYGFVEASRTIGTAGSQLSAVTRAQETVAMLKQLAEKDPNRRYILWRVSELEQQIYLEQEEMNLKNEYQRVTEINRLVAIFNEELFIKRPNFAKLHTLKELIDKISIKHGNQFADNINQKNKVVTQNLRLEIESAFSQNNYESVQEIYMYAVRNRKYLDVNMDYYNQWSGRIQAKQNADYLRANIGRQLANLRDLAQKNKIAEVRRNVSVIYADVESASRHLTSSFVQETNRELSVISSSTTFREDSLVQIAKNLAKAGKAEQASYYMNKVLRPAGINPDKIATIDSEIMGNAKIKKVENHEVNAEIEKISVNTNKENVSGTDFTAKIKMQGDSLKRHYSEMDSKARSHFVRANQVEFDQEQRRLDALEARRVQADQILEEVTMLVSKGKTGKADKLMEKNKILLLSSSTPDLYINSRKAINKSLGNDSARDTLIATMSVRQKEESAEKMEEKSESVTIDIYKLLGKRDLLGASGLFFRNEALLRKHSYAEAFQILKKQIVKEYSRKYMK